MFSTLLFLFQHSCLVLLILPQQQAPRVDSDSKRRAGRESQKWTRSADLLNSQTERAARRMQILRWLGVGAAAKLTNTLFIILVVVVWPKRMFHVGGVLLLFFSRLDSFQVAAAARRGPIQSRFYYRNFFSGKYRGRSQKSCLKSGGGGHENNNNVLIL